MQAREPSHHRLQNPSGLTPEDLVVSAHSLEISASMRALCAYLLADGIELRSSQESLENVNGYFRDRERDQAELYARFANGSDVDRTLRERINRLGMDLSKIQGWLEHSASTPIRSGREAATQLLGREPTGDNDRLVITPSAVALVTTKEDFKAIVKRFTNQDTRANETTIFESVPGLGAARLVLVNGDTSEQRTASRVDRDVIFGMAQIAFNRLVGNAPHLSRLSSDHSDLKSQYVTWLRSAADNIRVRVWERLVCSAVAAVGDASALVNCGGKGTFVFPKLEDFSSRDGRSLSDDDRGIVRGAIRGFHRALRQDAIDFGSVIHKFATGNTAADRAAVMAFGVSKRFPNIPDLEFTAPNR